MFSLAEFLSPIVTAGFQEPLDWETGLDEGMYNLQSEPTSPFLSHIYYEATTWLYVLFAIRKAIDLRVKQNEVGSNFIIMLNLISGRQHLRAKGSY